MIERDYGTAIASFRGVVAKTAARAVSTDAVSQVVERALTARSPKTRYVVGRDAKFQVAMARFITDRMRDRVVTYVIKLPRRASEMTEATEAREDSHGGTESETNGHERTAGWLGRRARPRVAQWEDGIHRCKWITLTHLHLWYHSSSPACSRRRADLDHGDQIPLLRSSSVSPVLVCELPSMPSVVARRTPAADMISQGRRCS